MNSPSQIADEAASRELPLRLALIGSHPAALALATAAASASDFRLVAAYDCPDHAARLSQLTAGLHSSTDWEVLLADSPVDGVIASPADDEAQLDRLRKLVSARVPLLLVHPASDAAIVFHELEMLRQDGLPVLMPYLPLRGHPAIDHVFELLSTSTAGQSSADAQAATELGPLEQFAMERHQLDRSELAVRRQFAQDVDLARQLAGELTQVAALAPVSPTGRLANLGVQLTGPAAVLVRWSVAPPETQPQLRLSISARHGHATLLLPDEGPAEVAWWIGDQRQSRQFDDLQPARRALETFAAAIAGADVRPNWDDAAQAAELTEAIDRSLARGRTIELAPEDFSETSSFRGLMSAIGCGLLLLAPMLLAVGAVAGQFGVPLAGYLPGLLLLVLVVFLLLQSLNLVLPQRKSR